MATIHSCLMQGTFHLPAGTINCPSLFANEKPLTLMKTSSRVALAIPQSKMRILPAASPMVLNTPRFRGVHNPSDYQDHNGSIISQIKSLHSTQDSQQPPFLPTCQGHFLCRDFILSRAGKRVGEARTRAHGEHDVVGGIALVRWRHDSKHL